MSSEENKTISEILLYQTEDGSTRIDVHFQDETVWLTQMQMADLFQTTKQNVSLHIKNVFDEGELEQKGTVKESLTVQKDELDLLNRFVSMYLDYAELQAINRKPMYMKDWVVKLDDFIRFNGGELLTHAGAVSHQMAIEKAHVEYNKYRVLTADEPSLVEKHFIDAMQQAVKQMDKFRQNDKDSIK